jgi:SsrA-binding protein
MATHQTSQPKTTPKPAEKTPRLLADNRKAGFDYEYLEQWEAGVVLLGTEVKAIREGRVNLRDSYARVEGSEVWVYNIHISPYSHRGYAEHEALRRRKLLLNRAEIRKLIGKVTEKGLTLVPTRMYLKNGRVKLNLALARGKKAHDKRETIKLPTAGRPRRPAARVPR